MVLVDQKVIVRAVIEVTRLSNQLRRHLVSDVLLPAVQRRQGSKGAESLPLDELDQVHFLCHAGLGLHQHGLESRLAVTAKHGQEAAPLLDWLSMLEVPFHVRCGQLVSFKLANRWNLLLGIFSLMHFASPPLLGECEARSVAEDLSQELGVE